MSMKEPNANRDVDFLSKIHNMEIEEEAFTSQMSLFSQYLTNSNKDYKYNRTYLTAFCQEFYSFVQYTKVKLPICNQIMLQVPFLDLGKREIQINVSFDGFIELNNYGIYKISEKFDATSFCSNHVQIKAVLTVKQKNYLFQKTEENFINNMGADNDRIEELADELEEWIKKHYDE